MSESKLDQNHLQSSLYAGITGLVLLTVFLLLRQGHSSEFEIPALLYWGTGLFFLFCPSAIRKLGKSFFQKNENSVFCSEAALTLYLFIAASLCGILIPHLEILKWIIASVGFLFFLYYLARTARKKVPLLALSICAIMLGLSLCDWSFVSRYHDILFMEKLACGSPFNLAPDTLFHASLTNMIANLGKITTGLDGLPYTAYHAGSHFIFAQWTKLLSQNSLSFFLYGYTLLVVPLFIKSLFTLYFEICNNLNANSEQEDRLPTFLFLILSLALPGFLPRELSEKIWVSAGPFSGESYGLSLILAFLTACLVLQMCRQEKENKSNIWVQIFFWCMCIPALCGVLTSCKFSTIYLFFGIFGYLFLRKHHFKNWIKIASLALSVLLSYFIYKALSFPYQTSVELFAFYKGMEPLHIALHVIFFYLPLWAILLLFLLKKNQEPGTKSALEAGFVFSIICFVPSIFVQLAGGVVIYFLEPQYWLNLVLFLACLIPFATSVNKKTIVCLSLFLLLQTALSLTHLSNSLQKDLATIAKIEPVPGRVAVLEKLYELSHLPLRTRRHTAVFIPQSQKDYWTMMEPLATPFLVPAITGMPMIDGLPPQGFIGTIYYNYAPYGFGVRPKVQQDSSEAKTRDRASMWGFRHLIRIEDPQSESRIIDLY